MTTITAPDVPAQSRRSRSWIGCAMLGVILGLAVALAVHFHTNFHAVVPGLVFRSAQLDPVALDDFIQRYHFHTIINLRGPSPETDWYQEERAVSRRRRIRFFDMPTDSRSPLTGEEIRQLLIILDEQDSTPILIHCQSGVDRSGAMAVICALLLDEANGLDRAKNQLCWSNGNFPWFTSTKNNLAYLDRYQEWLKQNRLDHSRAHFCQWALDIIKS